MSIDVSLFNHTSEMNSTLLTDKIIETDVARLEYDERGFLVIKLMDTGKSFDEEEAKRQIATAHEITGGKKCKVLVDTANSTTTPSIEAKKLIADVSFKTKEAVVVKSLGNRILGNIYMKIINRRYPCRIFNDKETAIEWLLEK